MFLPLLAIASSSQESSSQVREEFTVTGLDASWIGLDVIADGREGSFNDVPGVPRPLITDTMATDVDIKLLEFVGGKDGLKVGFT